MLRLRGGAESGEDFSTLKLQLEGSRPAARVEGVGRLPGLSHYLIGERRPSWRTGVPAYEKVRYSSVYPGVDLVYYGNQGRLEYDFHLAPGADPHRIGLRFEGARSVRLDGQGELVIGTEVGDVRQLKPVAFQEAGGVCTAVEVHYEVGRDGRVGFRVGAYDRARPLVIDPVILYSSYLGGTGAEQGLAIAVDAAGSAYVGGSTTSLDFPGASPIQNANGGFNDVFVLKFSPDGSSLVYATYLGGGGDDRANAVVVDATGHAYVAGLTGSGNFPRTMGAWQTTKDGSVDAFHAKLSPAGSALAYATFIGGSNAEEVFGLDVDAAGRAYVIGRSDSPSLRTLPPDLRAGDPVQRSTDGAATWAPSDAGLTPSIVNAFAFANATLVYASTSSGVFRSSDGGHHWQPTSTSSPPTAPGFTNAVALDPSNPSVVCLTDSEGQPLTGFPLRLTGFFPQMNTSTDGNGHYSFPDVGRNISYTVIPTATTSFIYERSLASSRI